MFHRIATAQYGLPLGAAMPSATDILDTDRARVMAAWRALCEARKAAWHSPNAGNIAAEENAEALMNRYLDRLPRA